MSWLPYHLQIVCKPKLKARNPLIYLLVISNMGRYEVQQGGAFNCAVSQNGQLTGELLHFILDDVL